MPVDLTPLDLAALAWMVILWIGYAVAVARLPSLNRAMQGVRLAWMGRMLRREVRIVDGQLVGHSMNSVSFFASTTTIVIAGLVGVLGGLDAVQPTAERLFLVARTSPELFELKVFVLLAIFIVAFLDFTWALRQYNYVCALIGSAPDGPLDDRAVDAAARPIARVMTLAIGSFNDGLRAYYFAVATLAWFVQPWLYPIAATAVAALLLRRQFASSAYHAIRDHIGDEPG